MTFAATMLWMSCGAFTVGFIKDPLDSFAEAVIVTVFWPAFLGNEIRKRLDK